MARLYMSGHGRDASKRAVTEAERSGAGRKLEDGFEWGALASLLPYLWPRGEIEIKLRVAAALAFLALAKIATVYIPFLYKEAVDVLGADGEALVVVPVGVILGYGVARLLATAFGELRDAVFAKVGQRAIRKVALATFRHLHGLALRFHLDRQTGGLSRAIERGTKSIDFLLRFALFNILPHAARTRHGLRHPVDPVQCLVRAGDAGDHRRLHRLHDDRHRMAPEIPQAHERERPGGEHAGDRQPAELRDRQVFRQ